MSRKILLEAVIAIAMLAAPMGAALAQDEQPRFTGSDLPPPEPTKLAPSLYDYMVIGETSPLGSKASSVKLDTLFRIANSFLHGTDGRTANAAEAAFWLKRAIALGPDDETLKSRPWALYELGNLATADPQAGIGIARQLWELAGAWNSPGSTTIASSPAAALALCNLGDLSVWEKDTKQALIWYDRAKKAGCAKASDAISKLPK
jgi:TPR repeat protein